MAKYIFSFLWLISGFCLSFSQGKLMIAGGGLIYPGGWSDAPYAWAINQAHNHKVAIIRTSYTAENQEDYLIDLGAAKVRYFAISFPALANHKPTIDSLMLYDFWLFEEQSPVEMYTIFRNTKLDSAVEAKFQQGGVIGTNGNAAALLSDVVFTGAYGNIESAEALADVRDARIQLKNDFFSLTEGYVIDPSFSEKGRFGRTLAFMARWWVEKKEVISGLGIDEQTAFCVDSMGNGRVYGTGAAVLLLNDISADNFTLNAGKPVIDSLRFIQLLDGDQFNIISWEVKGMHTMLTPGIGEEMADQTLLFSGGTDLSGNERFLDTLIYGTGYPSDKILIITGESDSYAQVVKAMLEARGAAIVNVLRTTEIFENDPAKNAEILASHKFLFAHNDPAALTEFLRSGTNGPLLLSRVLEPATIGAFMGQDCQLASPWLISPQQVRSATLTDAESHLFLQPGLGILQTTAIIPQSEDQNNYFSYPTTGIPYLMANKTLAYGVSLSEGSFLKYYTAQNQTWMISHGKNPAILLHNPGTNIHVRETEYPVSRNATGFDNMRISLLDSIAFRLGTVTPPAEESQSENADWINIYPNPVKENMNILLTGKPSGTYTFQLLNSDGQNVITQTFVLQPNTHTIRIPVPDLLPGVYMLLVKESGKKIIKRIQVIH
ncbi:MAG: T9SS type A sorting domain-containing protein [Bacteroidia bacterium]